MAMRYALVHLFFLLSLAASQSSNATTTTKPGCQSSCGNVEIPFPFGIGPDCSQNKYFNINCNNTSFNPPKPYLSFTNNVSGAHYNYTFEVVNISKSQIYVKNPDLQQAYTCYDVETDFSIIDFAFYPAPYTISDANQITVVGCDDMAIVRQYSDLFGNFNSIGCKPYCNQSSNGRCPGLGCCQTPISKTDAIQVVLADVQTIWSYDRKYFGCSFAFIGMKGYLDNFTFHFSDLNDSTIFRKKNQKFVDTPLLLDWRNGAYSKCTKTSCGKNSLCNNWDSFYKGYDCRCKEGYDGNPYLSSGCQDIDECKDNPCASNGICINKLGSYECHCSDGYYGDGKKNGTQCTRLPVYQSKVIIGNIFYGFYYY